MAAEKGDLSLKDLKGQVKVLYLGVENLFLDPMIEKDGRAPAPQAE